MIVSVAVLTYNQVDFIGQCLDSILMQKVDFDYEIVVGDDCSTDGTQIVLEDYQKRFPDKFVPLLKDRNEGISKNYQNVLNHCKGKYVALCEGDDYWTAKDKLQTQIDFLERYEDFGFVGTYSQLLFPDGQVKEDAYDYLPKPETIDGWELYGDVFEYVKSGPVTRTVSLCFRRSIIEPYIQYDGLGNDMVLQTVLARHSWFAKYKKPMTMYRQGGMSTDNNCFEKKMRYNEWYVRNRLLQKELFPNDCNWDENELMDGGVYLKLCHAIQEKDWKKALSQKQLLKTDAYKRKNYSRFLFGPFSCLLLSLFMSVKHE